MKKRLVPAIIFTVVFLVYMLSEALLRRRAYNLPPADSTAARSSLVEHLPQVFQAYFHNLEKIAVLERKLAKTTEPAARRKLLFKLAHLVKDDRRREIYAQIIREAPNSPQVARAWAGLLPGMSASEILDKYLAYVADCKIRSQREKIEVWQTGWFSLRRAPAAARLKYLSKMAAARVVAADLMNAYEELWTESAVGGDPELTKRAAELLEACKQRLQQEQRKFRRK